MVSHWKVAPAEVVQHIVVRHASTQQHLLVFTSNSPICCQPHEQGKYLARCTHSPTATVSCPGLDCRYRFDMSCVLSWCAATCCALLRGNPHLQPILGLAWDFGAVTTGPVTVPILIALGVSVMKAQRQKQRALATVEDAAVNRSKGETA
jgi:hypothetical protein